MNNVLELLKKANRDMLATDRELSREIESRVKGPVRNKEGLPFFEGLTIDPSQPSEMIFETIVLRTGRPVLAVRGNTTDIIFSDADSEVWRSRLTAARGGIDKAIRATGRIEIENDPRFDWLGTGWLVSDNVIVTNRHVAEIFGQNQGSSFVFRQNHLGKRINASIDFLEEVDNAASAVFRIRSIIHIEPPSGPDMAFLHVEPVAGKKLPDPVSLFTKSLMANRQVAVIGYPARDSRIPEQDLMERIFGNVYNKKRVAPGFITGVNGNTLLHDGSTLGGNSGSIVLDLESGCAAGLHFAGRFLESNYAVPAASIAERLRTLNISRKPCANTVVAFDEPQASPTSSISGADARQPDPQPPGRLSLTIPLHIDISLGLPEFGKLLLTAGTGSLSGDTDELFITEAHTDYSDRDGYTAGFLGNDARVTLPVIKDHHGDVLYFTENGKDEFILKYRHFSVVMSKSRRQCFYSAVNIDGINSVGSKRGKWRTDPRIPQQAQLLKECYGNPPKFSRGHMTRREDPVWGPRAEQGNQDSMHVTNAVPQMQSFNGGIWLKLEDYALQHARQDDMRISVFTGPVFDQGDPERYGVKVPLTFWKVIAFIHDETGKLCATGYMISQLEYLPDGEFVYGEHGAAQVAISDIERLTGLSFGNLASLDPLAGTEAAADEWREPLQSLKEIRFQ